MAIVANAIDPTDKVTAPSRPATMRDDRPTSPRKGFWPYYRVFAKIKRPVARFRVSDGELPPAGRQAQP